MKSYFALASFLSISALSLAPIIAFAQPAGINITVKCPAAKGSQNVVTNFGDYIAGYGEETIQNQGAIPVYFKSGSATGLPSKLDGYNNYGVNYESSTGQVTCNFSSVNPKEPPFSVSYTLTNGKGGTVTAQGQDFVKFTLPVGLRG